MYTVVAEYVTLLQMDDVDGVWGLDFLRRIRLQSDDDVLLKAEEGTCSVDQILNWAVQVE